MLVTLSTATAPQSGLVLTNVIVAAVFAGLFWLFLRVLRKRVSARRKERWAEEDRREQDRLDPERRDAAGDEDGTPRP